MAERLFGCGGLARFLGITETAVRQMRIPPDALVDGRRVWTEATAKRLAAERAARKRQREERLGEPPVAA